MVLKGTEIVEKKNVLNEIRSNNMTLQELRFFSIYLSKINARDINTRVVRFPLSDFQKIMELGRMNIQHIKQTTDNLLMNIVHLSNEKGGYTSFQLFKECTVSQDDYGEWYVEIDSHDKALPLMFDFKSKYFTYELWNALRLKSANQVRMYEILKQYQNTGKREINVIELRGLLGIAPDEYPRWDNFKRKVIDSCQQSLEENTDIKFTYERGKTGTGGKWLTIIFCIEKNNNYIDQLTLDEFIDMQQSNVFEENEFCFQNKNLEFLADACNNEFNETEMTVLNDLIVKLYPFGTSETEKYNFLYRKYNELNIRAARSDLEPIKSRFGWLKNSLQREVDKT
mgnify:FL=1